jgi:hypothetical protein
VSVVACVSMDETECFEFWYFYVDIDVMRVYVVGAGGHVSSCLCGLLFRRSVVGSLVVFLFAVLY